MRAIITTDFDTTNGSITYSIPTVILTEDSKKWLDEVLCEHQKDLKENNYKLDEIHRTKGYLSISWGKPNSNDTYGTTYQSAECRGEIK